MIALIIFIVLFALGVQAYDEHYHAKERQIKAKRMQARIQAAQNAYRPKWRPSKPVDR